jgi:hypothetical protein
VLEVLPENKREEFLGHLKLVADACRESAELVSKQPKSKTPESRAKHDASTPDATAPIVADLP